MLAFDPEKYRIRPGQRISLADYDPADTQGLDDKDAARALLKEHLDEIETLQERLYAEDRQSILLVLQGMDTSGKDSTISRVTEGLNPQGVRVTSFKVPSSEALQHDFLWRIHAHTPERGMIRIFNRSHYEDVLVVRVHELVPPELIDKRYAHINDFERLLSDHGTRVIKIMLHISKAYQLERLQRRLRRPDKHWKFNPGDLKERKLWDDYQDAYEQVLARCSTEYAPWYAVPAQRRWFRDLVISRILLDALRAIDPQYPEPDFDPADYPPETLE